MTTAKQTCECADRGCPVHQGVSHCERPANTRLFRIDMADSEGVHFCEECGADALESGVFATWEEKRGIR